MVSAAADASSRHVHRKDLEPAAGIALPLSTHVLCRFSVTISTNLPSSPGVPRAGQLGSAIAEGAGGRDGAPVSIVEGHSSAVGSWALHAGSPDHAGVAAPPMAGGRDTLKTRCRDNSSYA